MDLMPEAHPWLLVLIYILLALCAVDVAAKLIKLWRGE